jgi:threonine 3-dehydrogenase
MSATMLAVMKGGPQPGATVAQVEMPSCGPDDLLLKVRATSICGTDLHIYNWDPWAQGTIRPPLVFGHEFTGEVVEAGRAVTGFTPGDCVSVESHIPCTTCHQCTHGRMHICDRLKIVGVHRPGCFAQYASVPAIVAWKNTPGMPPDLATLMEPMGNAVHAVSAAGVAGKSVAVFGCGPAGLFSTATSKAYGAASIFAVDVNANRLELARTVGADECFNGADPDLVGTLVKRSGGYGLDVAFEMSGNPKAMANALRSLKKGGTVVAFGLPSKTVEVDLANDVILTGRTVLGIVGRLMFDTWKEMQRLLDEGRLNPRPIITHTFRLAEFEKAITTFKAEDARVGKVVMMP